jgi:hypothetical protein
MVMRSLLFAELFLQHPLYSNLTSFNEKINTSFIYYFISIYIYYIIFILNIILKCYYIKYKPYNIFILINDNTYIK